MQNDTPESVTLVPIDRIEVLNSRDRNMKVFVERQPPCPRATTTLAGFQAAEVGVSFNVSG